MLEIILLAALSPANPLSSVDASVQPCVWPNTCAQSGAAVAASGIPPTRA